jgi:hypothetical protein
MYTCNPHIGRIFGYVLGSSLSALYAHCMACCLLSQSGKVKVRPQKHQRMKLTTALQNDSCGPFTVDTVISVTSIFSLFVTANLTGHIINTR